VTHVRTTPMSSQDAGGTATNMKAFGLPWGLSPGTPYRTTEASATSSVRTSRVGRIRGDHLWKAPYATSSIRNGDSTHSAIPTRTRIGVWRLFDSSNPNETAAPPTSAILMAKGCRGCSEKARVRSGRFNGYEIARKVKSGQQ